MGSTATAEMDARMRGALSLSVVIPTLNAAATLPGTLAALAWDDVVISDGGSTDGTRDIAGIRLVASPRGRGVQIAAGVAAAVGPSATRRPASSRCAPTRGADDPRRDGEPDQDHQPLPELVNLAPIMHIMSTQSFEKSPDQ